MVAIALALLACTSGPTPTQGPSLGPSAVPSPSANWPPFEPGNVHQAVARAFGMACGSIEARIRCQTVRDSGARFEATGPDGTDDSDRELIFTASGPIELESEARRLFATVADAISGNQAQSREWQDQIWAVFTNQSPPATELPTALPNGASWSASLQAVGDVLVWSLRLTW